MIKLGVIVDSGSHVAAWRHPDVPADAAWSFDHVLNVTRTAEAGLFDMVFFADALAAEHVGDDRTAGFSEPAKHLEPLLLLAALAVSTRKIGLVSTATTTYYQPFHLARYFATLDHISGGRAGWNLVTSLNLGEAVNFGLHEHPSREERYLRAREFFGVVRDLWGSWDADAFVYDKQSGSFYDKQKFRRIDHQGAFFNVAGPLNVPRSPQGRPVVTQAGSSAAGMSLGAETADVIFTAQVELGAAVEFATDIRKMAAGFGRDPASVKIMPGIVPFVAASKEEARRKLDRLDDLVDPSFGTAILSELLGGTDLSGHDVDGPLPPLPASNASVGRQSLFVRQAQEQALTIRDLYKKACVANGHRLLFGTASEIADELICWHRAGAADGFVLIPAWLPGGLQDFVAEVVPILQERGYFRLAYEGNTLRANLGLEVPN
ncbi:LLM class flavin-dependent oxidoreductase [Mesorhizobium sp. 113-3-3]|uniref:LLM class flavin-dependent oxidoreductase n=1 Tax=Mesorhizobium sp. 113-3-3 TaxID=2744516 RepID=UPI001925C945|nr:LLM class flavin-dependent oxidoreductase [Mesorhizobium sp. 113-3-3]BCG82208.1 monooxygenase [Mesorhizobium sp. 113-3-3]